jgi:hypothetical protein
VGTVIENSAECSARASFSLAFLSRRSEKAGRTIIMHVPSASLRINLAVHVQGGYMHALCARRW